MRAPRSKCMGLSREGPDAARMATLTAMFPCPASCSYCTLRVGWLRVMPSLLPPYFHCRWCCWRCCRARGWATPRWWTGCWWTGFGMPFTTFTWATALRRALTSTTSHVPSRCAVLVIRACGWCIYAGRQQLAADADPAGGSTCKVAHRRWSVRVPGWA
jgi:hypothetical protein